MKVIAALATAALAACTPTAESEAVAPPESNTTDPFTSCDAAKGQYAVGQKFSDALAAELKTKTGADKLRVIAPGMAVTMDFRGDRLNISYDANNLIDRVSCG
jgi:Peptidase inhibitor I78 family